MFPAHVEKLPARELICWALGTYGPQLAFTTSFQAEGMAIIDMASRITPSIRVVTVDTGRLPRETYDMIETVRARYGVRVEVASPDPAEVEAMVTHHGQNLFYNSLAERSLCCAVRKVRPLERKMKEFRAWVTGLRREHSTTRAELPKVEERDGLLKISPLVDWKDAELEDYLTRNDVPRHPLYARGYSSIGCAPCTRATQPGEDARAGRWWWEHENPKECGIHFSADGKIERKADVLLREIISPIPQA